MAVYKLSEEITLAHIDENTQLYMWIKYADDALGNGMSDLPEGKSFMGVAYNKTVKEESTNPSDYEWVDIKGADGIPGPPGTSTYMWVKYSMFSNGDQMQDDPNGMIYMGVAYNKNTPTESTNPQDYVWSRFRGEDGIEGKPGAPGEDGISPIVASIESTQGNFFKQGVGTTTLKVTVYQGADDVSEQCTYHWQKIDNEQTTPDPNWHKEGNNITITQDDVAAKSVFIVHVTYTNLTAKANYTISSLFDMNPSIVPPVNPQEGQVWLDISKEPPVLMVFSGGKWQPSSKDWSNEIGEILKDITILNQNYTNVNAEIVNMKDSIALKVDTNTFNETTKIINANISGLKDQIDNLSIPGTNLINLYGDKVNILDHPDGGQKVTRNDFDVTVNSTSAFGGIYFNCPFKKLKVDGEYVLSYKFQKIDGTLVNIGGHLDSLFLNSAYINPTSLIIDGASRPLGNYVSTVTLTDDKTVHTIEIRFKVVKTEGGEEYQRMFIQPNRSVDTPVTTKIYDIMFEESKTASTWQPSASDLIYLGRQVEFENILRNSGFNDLTDRLKYWAYDDKYVSANWSNVINSYFVTIKRTNWNNTDGRVQFIQKLDMSSIELTKLIGKPIILSCLIQCNQTIPAQSNFYIRVYRSDKSFADYCVTEINDLPKNQWYRAYSIPVILPDKAGTTITQIDFGIAGQGNFEFYAAQPMLNISQGRYSWSPSPKDIQKAAEDAKAQAIVYTDTQITATKAEIKVEIDNIKLGVEQNRQDVQQVIKDFNDLTIDTYNLIDYSSFRPETQAIVKGNKWTTNDSTRGAVFGVISSSHIDPVNSHLLGENWINFDKKTELTWLTINVYPQKTHSVGATYTASAYLWNRSTSHGSWIRIVESDYEDLRDAIYHESQFVKVVGKFTLVTVTYKATKKYARFQALTDGPDFATCHPMWSQSTKYVPWQVSPIETSDRVETNVQNISKIDIKVNSITQTVSSLSEQVTQVDGKITGINSRLETAEQKIQPDSITQTVIQNQYYQNDLNQKLYNLGFDRRNFLINSTFDYSRTGWQYGWNDYSRIADEKGRKNVLVIIGQLGNKATVIAQGLPRGTKINPGQKYTFSCDVYSEGVQFGTTNPHVQLYAEYYKGDSYVAGIGGVSLEQGNKSWKRIKYTFTARELDDYDTVRIQAYCRDFSGRVFFDNFKCEAGDTMTPWGPAMEDFNLVQNNRNLIYNSGEFVDTKYWNTPHTNNRIMLESDGTLRFDSVEYSTWGTYLNNYSLKDRKVPFKFEVGQEYVVSFRVKSNVAAGQTYTLQICDGNSSNYVVGHTFKATPQWQTIEFKFTATIPGNENQFRFTTGTTTETQIQHTFYVEWVKLEKGHKTIGWTPAPEDLNIRTQERPNDNLLYNSGFTQEYHNGWARNPGSIHVETYKENLSPSGYGVKFVAKGGNNGIYQRYTKRPGDTSIDFPKGKILTLSGWVLSSMAADALTIGLEGVATTSIPIPQANTWVRFEKTINVTKNGGTTFIYYSAGVDKERTMQLFGLKIEYGGQATPWCLSSNELGNRLREAEIKITPESIVARISEKAKTNNLIGNSSGVGGTYPWKSNLPNGYWTGFISEPADDATSGWNLRLASNIVDERYAFSSRFVVKHDKPITISGYAWMESNVKGMDIFFLTHDDNALRNQAGNHTMQSDAYKYVAGSIVLDGKPRDQWVYFEATFPAKGNSAYIRLDHNGVKDVNNNSTRIWVRDLMVNHGEIAMPWSDYAESSAESELKLTPDKIVGKVTSGLGSGHNVKVATIELTKDGFSTSSSGYVSKIWGGKFEVRDSTGHLVSRIDRSFELYRPVANTANASDFAGGVQARGSTASDKSFCFFGDDGEHHLSFGFSHGDGGIDDSVTTYFRIDRADSIFHNWCNLDMHGYKIVNANFVEESSSSDGLFLGSSHNIMIRSNQINSMIASGWLQLNYWTKADQCGVNIGRGYKDGSQGLIQAAEFRVKKTLAVYSTLARMGTVKRVGSTGVRSFIEDIGEFITDEEGKAYIPLNSNFMAQCDTAAGYQVMLQAYNGGVAGEIKRFATYFEVTSEPKKTFGYILKGLVRNEEAEHLVIQPVENTLKDEASEDFLRQKMAYEDQAKKNVTNVKETIEYENTMAIKRLNRSITNGKEEVESWL